MNSALRKRLSDAQWNKLVESACSRRKEVKSGQEGQDWTMKRERYEKIASGDVWYRLSANGYGGALPAGAGGVPQIFDRINESLGIVQSVRRFLVARICKDLFGSNPWFYVQPEGAVNQDLSEKLQQHSDWKLQQACYVTRIKETVGIALDLGECPVKTTWEKEIDISERMATLLTHRKIPANGGQAGKPVLTADGDTLEDSDETTGGDPAVDDQGNPIANPDGSAAVNPVSFVKAPEVQIDPAKHEWADHFIEEQTILFQGLNIAACHWRDVNWPINAPSLAKADFVSHTFDVRWSKLRAQYAPDSFTGEAEEAEINPVDEEEPEDGQEPTDAPLPPDKPLTGSDAKVMDILNSIRASSRGPKSHESQPRPGEAEMLGGEVDDPIIKVEEVSYDFDCFEDGIVRRLWMVVLPDFDQCIFADFRANICPRAAKPIHLVTINQVKHRAYGKGLHETYEKMANVADGLLCSILYKNKINSDPVKIWNPDRTNEGAANPTLIIEPGRTYSMKGSQWGPKDVMACLEIPDLDDRTWKLMELFMQLIQVDSGVTNANQGDMTDLPSNTTATGVNSMLESSSVLHQYILEEIRDSLTPHLGYCVELIYKMQDRNETFDYLEQDVQPGSPNAQQSNKTIERIMQLSDAKQLNGLPMQAEFLLTRAKRQEQREAAMAAIPIGVQYGTLGPKDQARMNDAFVQLFRALGFDEPEDFFPMPDPNTPPPAPPLPRASEVIALKGTDLAANQKDALAQQLGLPPAVGPMPTAPPQTPAGSPVSSSPQSQPPPAIPMSQAPLPSNVIPDPGDAAKVPDHMMAPDPADAGTPAQ